MPISELHALRCENRELRAELRRRAGTGTEAFDRRFPVDRSTEDGSLLLTMAEGLIEAHRAAKAEANLITIELIQAALFHVGGRLAREVRTGRALSAATKASLA